LKEDNDVTTIFRLGPVALVARDEPRQRSGRDYQIASIIKVTAGGSVVHETLFPGQPHEMVSVYTVDGPDLIMTHYCVLGNQPRMKADPKSPANQIVFRFAGGTNLDPKKDKHMHEATLTIVDDDHLEVSGIGWENGAPAKEMCCGLKLVRKH
jgi:hypothetical protein